MEPMIISLVVGTILGSWAASKKPRINSQIWYHIWKGVDKVLRTTPLVNQNTTSTPATTAQSPTTSKP